MKPNNPYKFKKGDKVRTREGNIETVIKVNSNGNIETVENDYSWPPTSLTKITENKSLPTKRQIQIVEDFVKKTTKTMMNEGYTEDQLSKIEVGGEYPAKFIIKSSSGSTNYISITQESAKSLMKWLNKNMKSFPA